MIVSYASPAGRRVVFADANPAILTLPTATLASLDEARVPSRPPVSWRDGAGPAGPGAGPPPGFPVSELDGCRRGLRAG